MAVTDSREEFSSGKSFEGAVPYWADRDPVFMEFLYSRDLLVKEKMPFMHERVTKTSREILKVDICEQVKDFRAYLCPVRVKVNGEFTHPIILTYCKWQAFSQMLYWPMEMIPLTNEERSQVWEGFVKDDRVYYEKRTTHFL